MSSAGNAETTPSSLGRETVLAVKWWAGCHVEFVCSMWLRIVISLRMQATKATFLGLPAAQSLA